MFDVLLHAIQLIFGKIFWVVETIKCALWNLVYGIGSLLLMFLDFVQDCFKKLAGLDTYYYEGTDAAFEREDILQRLLTTPEILKAFGSLVVVGIILLFLFTIIQFIRVEYTTEGAKNSKGNIIQQSLKSLAMFVIVPVACMIGIFLSNKILQILDRATAPNPGATVAGNIFKIAVYDANPVRAGTSTYAFTANAAADAMQMAKYLSGYEAYEGPEFEFFGYEKVIPSEAANWFDMGVSLAAVVKLQVQATKDTYINPAGIETQKYEIFDSPIELNFKDKESNKVLFGLQTDATDLEPSILKNKGGEELAAAIDDMISHRRQTQAKSSVGTVVIAGQGTVPFSLTTCIYKGEYMDYTNFRVVGYFYNVQDINYVILFVCSGFAIVCLYKAAFGMVMRLYMCSVLFIISPPIIAMAPMDNGKALSSWKSKFIGQVLAGYGTVVALNVFFTILPIIEKIELFSSTHKNELTGRADVPWILLPASFFNGLVQVVFILVGCFMLKDISKTISGLIGAEDAMASGDGMSKQVGAPIAKLGAAAIGGAAGLAMKATSGIAGKLGTKGAKGVEDAKEADAEAQGALDEARNKSAQKSFGKDYGELSDKEKQQIDNDKRRTGVQKALKNKAATEATLKQKSDAYNSKGKQFLRKASVATSIHGARFTQAAKTNIVGTIAGTGVGKFIGETTGGFAPKILGGKGMDMYDKELASSDDYLAEAIGSRDKARSQRQQEFNEKHNPAKKALDDINDRALLGQVGEKIAQNIAEGMRQQSAEVSQMRKQIVDIISDIKAGFLSRDDGTKQLGAILRNAKDSGILSAKSEASLNTALTNFAAGGSVAALEADINSNVSFESKFSVAMQDSSVKAQFDQLKDYVEKGKTEQAAQTAMYLKNLLAGKGVNIQGVDEILKEIKVAAGATKVNEKDLKKLLAQLGKLTK